MINFEKRLENLKKRRQGSRENAIIEAMDPAQRVDIGEQEDYELIDEPAGIRYLLGATKPIDPRFTRSIVEDGVFMAGLIVQAFEELGQHVDIFLQGALACNVHVKKNACPEIVLINKLTSKQQRYEKDPYDLMAFSRTFRARLERVLKEIFYSDFLEFSEDGVVMFRNRRSARSALLVPAVCYEEYSGISRFGNPVSICDKDGSQLICCNPKKLLKLIDERDTLYFGNMRRVLRLFFNVVADMPNHKKALLVSLSKRELVSIAYSMSMELDTFPGNISGLLERVRAHLQFICDSEKFRKKVVCLDSGRKVFSTREKVVALEILRTEFRELSSAVYREIAPHSALYRPEVMLNTFIA